MQFSLVILVIISEVVRDLLKKSLPVSTFTTIKIIYQIWKSYVPLSSSKFVVITVSVVILFVSYISDFPELVL